MRIACNKTADFPVHGFNGIEATSDSDGRYSLVGLPKGKGNKAIVIPAKGQPYLASAIEIPDTPGLDPVVLDVGLKHGIVIEGRVTDRDTGKPVRSIVEYNTFRDNPHLKEAPGFDRSAVWQQYVTEPDGTYRVVALAGRGLVAAMAIGAGEEYLPGVGLKVDQETLIGTVVPHNTPWNFNTFADLEVPAERHNGSQRPRARTGFNPDRADCRPGGPSGHSRPDATPHANVELERAPADARI